MAAMHDITLRANGLEFTATSYGEGPIVLCLHGFPDHRNTYRHQFEAFAQAGYRSVAPALRGFEPSSQPADRDYHVVRMAEDVMGWIDALGAQQVHLLGHDWGAIIAYTAAAMAPERFFSLSTLAIPHPGSLLRHQALRRLPRQFRRSWYIFFFQLPWLPEYVLSRQSWSFVETLWRQWSPGWTPPRREIEAVKRVLAQPGVKSATLAYYRSLKHVGSAARKTLALQFAPLRVPTLAITGALDGCMDTALFDLAMEEVDFPAGLSVSRIDDAGHFLHQECPSKINSELISWFDRHSSM